MSPLLRLYLGFSTLSGPLWRAIHKRRLARGKEVAERLPEKYGHYASQPSSKPVLWFHALSVGESFALLPLIELALKEMPQAQAVLTTSTASSVEALAKAQLPDRCQHVLLPIDTPSATCAFLDHWQPVLAAFAELDFWPRLMVETHRRDIPMVLINSRMPDRNFEKRRKLGGMMRDILGLFARLLVQDDLSKTRFISLGANPERVETVGALKAAARPLAVEEAELAELRSILESRPIWCAAATERSEHTAMIEAHREVAATFSNALLIFAPRFKDDGPEVERLARVHFENVARRSEGQNLTEETQVYVADTFGEMGLWYRLAPVSFVGHSLTAGLEGKNPFEAAALGSAILSGKNISYFSESYEALLAEGACRYVADAPSLAKAVIDLQSPDVRDKMKEGAARVIEARRAVLTRTWDTLKSAMKS